MADYTPEQIIAMQKNGDLGTTARFFRKPCYSAFLSNEQGKEVLVDKDYVEIKIAGEREPRVLMVNDSHKTRFPKEWRAYKDDVELQQTGTPIENLHEISDAQKLLCKSYNITHIEQLAELNDDAIRRLGVGGYEMKEKAIGYLDDATTRIEEDSKNMKQQLAEQQALIEKLLREKEATSISEEEPTPKPTKQATRKRAKGRKVNESVNNSPKRSKQDQALIDA